MPVGLVGARVVAQVTFMDGDSDDVGVVVTTGRCPRCEVCGRAVRTRGVGRVGLLEAANHQILILGLFYIF